MSEYQDWMQKVRKTGLALHIVPQSSRTPELCEAAVRQDGQALVYVPSEMRTPELCELAGSCAPRVVERCAGFLRDYGYSRFV